ncbi:MAG: outer membrane beta-barrel protein [Gemmatimonadaceae bacterium]
MTGLAERCLTPVLAVLIAVPVGAQAPDGGATGLPHMPGSGGTSTTSLSFNAGTFNYDAGGDDYYPFAAVRIDHEVSRFFVIEAGAAYAAVETESVDRNSGLPVASSTPAPLTLADVTVQFQFPLSRVRPFLGAGAGVIARMDGGPGDTGERFVRPSFIGVAGVRFDVTERLGFRGEVRARRDTHPGFTALDVEQSIGFTLRL